VRLYHLARLNGTLETDFRVVEKLYHRMVWEMPALGTVAMESGLFKTYSIPSISKLLAATKEFEEFGNRRVEDTSLILGEISQNSLETERSKLALKRLNFLHGKYKIANDDMLYTLSIFMFMVSQWSERFGWRAFTEEEKNILFLYWREIGKRMNITGIPRTREEMESWTAKFEKENLKYSKTNQQVGEAVMNAMVSVFPRILQAFLRELFATFLELQVLEAMGFKRPSAVMYTVGHGILYLYKYLVRWFPPRVSDPRQTPFQPNSEGLYIPRFVLFDKESYQKGYTIECLGPKKFINEATTLF
jgi:hypothetical protein